MKLGRGGWEQPLGRIKVWCYLEGSGVDGKRLEEVGKHKMENVLRREPWEG